MYRCMYVCMYVCIMYYIGHRASQDNIQEAWRYVYHLHFLKRAEQTAQKCQRGFVLRQHSPEVRTSLFIMYTTVMLCL